MTKFKCKLQRLFKVTPFARTQAWSMNATGRSRRQWRFAPDFAPKPTSVIGYIRSYCFSQGLYTLWVKKGTSVFLSITLANINRFSNFSLLNLAINLQQSGCYISQHTLNLLLSYITLHKNFWHGLSKNCNYLVKWQLSQTKIFSY